MKTQKLLVIVASVCLMAFFNVLSFAQTTPVQPALAGSMAEVLAQSLAAQGYEVLLDGNSVKIATNRGELSLDLPAAGEGLKRDEITVSIDGMVVKQDDSVLDGFSQEEEPNVDDNLLIALEILQTCIGRAGSSRDLDTLFCDLGPDEPIKDLLCQTQAELDYLKYLAKCIAQFEYLSADVVANAGDDQAVDTFIPVNLDGNGSTPPPADWEGYGFATTAWEITAKPQGSMAVLSDPNIVDPVFVPDVDGTYTVELTYTFLVESDTDSVDVVATTPPTP